MTVYIASSDPDPMLLKYQPELSAQAFSEDLFFHLLLSGTG